MVVNQALANIINRLNLDLSNEYAAEIQYTQHAACLSGPEYFAIIAELEKHALEEHAHSVTLSDLINYLGGVPTVKVAERLISPDNAEMLHQDLQGEYTAINRYLERIAQLEALGLYDISQRIRQIAADEQEHANDLQIALGIKTDQPAIPQQQTVYVESYRP
jgi:bacterioferritin